MSYVKTLDGDEYEYRLVSARLERRRYFGGSRGWSPVTGEMFLQMSANELRYVADILDRPLTAEARDG